MNSQELVQTEELTQSLQLVKGLFTSAEASNVVITLIDQKINFHKIQRFQLWEGNHECKTEQINKRIKELEQEKEVAKEFISKIQELGSKIKIDAVLKMSIEE